MYTSQSVTEFELTLLNGWEEVYLKSQLTLWLLLGLKAGEKHMAEIKDFIATATNDLLSPDDRSMYRTLRRLTAGSVIQFTTKPAKNGPDYKVYELTKEGRHVLAAFVERNITSVYFNPTIRNLMKAG